MARSPCFVAVLEIEMLARQELPAAALRYPDLQHANFGRRAFSAGLAFDRHHVAHDRIAAGDYGHGLAAMDL